MESNKLTTHDQTPCRTKHSTKESRSKTGTRREADNRMGMLIEVLNPTSRRTRSRTVRTFTEESQMI